MNDREDNVIIAYNIFCTIMVPFLEILAGIWTLETGSDYTRGRLGGLPVAAVIVFVPEVILGLKWEIIKEFTIPCSFVWYGFLCKMSHYFFQVETDAPITYYGTMGIMLLGLLWTLVIELLPGLKKHLLKYPQEEWLVPCSENPEWNRRLRSIWKVSLILVTIFTLAIKWGIKI